jgi:hypothetical protein
MSLLPQRKKTAEEIAKLRESLGVPGVSQPSDAAPAPDTTDNPPDEVETIVATHHEATVVHAADPEPAAEPAPLPPPAHHGPKPVHSLKRSERMPEEPIDETHAEAPAALPLSPAPRAVRSLRKSEQAPRPEFPHSVPSADSKIPAHRHNDSELHEIRRREALAMLHPAANPKLAVAHPALIVPGYLLAIAGASCFVFYQFPMAATAACSAASLALAAFIFVRRPSSRHHAAFIAVIALFVIVFGVLHYFPHLRHAT